jgi:pimeloyl-ACP methyl ester carboxylesterase
VHVHGVARTRSIAWLSVSLLAAIPCAALEPKPVTFPAADGFRISADYYPPPVAEARAAPLAVLLHGYAGDRKGWPDLLVPLHEAGFAILALDLRGHGDSSTTESHQAVEKREPELFKRMQNDVLGAYQWLVEQPKTDRARFVLVGADVGASIALQYAAKDRSVDAVVCLSPGLNYLGLDSSGDIRQITGRPILLLATEDERDAPYTLEQKTTGVSVRVFHAKPAHGTELLQRVPDVARDIASFVRSAAGEPSPDVVYGSIESNIYHAADSGWRDRIAAKNLRYYSSPAEAEARGLRPSRSKNPDEPVTDKPVKERPRGQRPPRK